MISRIAIGALVLAACAAATPALAQSWIQRTGVHPDYNALDPAYGAGMGRHLPVVVAIEPRSLSAHTTARVVASGMRGVDGPSPSQAEARDALVRVVWTFDDEWWSTAGACRRSFALSPRSKLIPAVVRNNLLVSATLCRGDVALSQVVGFTSKSPDVKSPRFVAFIGDMTSALFPSASGARERR